MVPVAEVRQSRRMGAWRVARWRMSRVEAVRRKAMGRCTVAGWMGWLGGVSEVIGTGDGWVWSDGTCCRRRCP